MDQTEARSGECTALPRVGFLSNPRRIHSKREDEEKGEQGLLNNLPLPFPLPLHTHRAPAGLPRARFKIDVVIMII